MNLGANKRALLRWLHIIVTIPIFGYIYGPAAEVGEYAGAVRYLFVPIIVLSRIMDVRRTTLRHPGRGGITRDLSTSGL